VRGQCRGEKLLREDFTRQNDSRGGEEGGVEEVEGLHVVFQKVVRESNIGGGDIQGKTESKRSTTQPYGGNDKMSGGKAGGYREKRETEALGGSTAQGSFGKNLYATRRSTARSKAFGSHRPGFLV